MLSAKSSFSPTRPVDVAPKMTVGNVYFFLGLALTCPALMSYDGGATSMSTAALLQAGWSTGGISVLCTMDKLGAGLMTFVTNVILTKVHHKLVIVGALILKAASCLLFGVLHVRWTMFVTKFLMGASECVINIWVPCWIEAHAPSEALKVTLLGLPGTMMGVGNIVGGTIMGFCYEGLGFSFAFILQSICLFAVVFIMILQPGDWFDMDGDPGFVDHKSEEAKEVEMAIEASDTETQPLTGGGDDQSSSSQTQPNRMNTDERICQKQKIKRLRSLNPNIEIDPRLDSVKEPSIVALMKAVVSNRLWLWTALSISLSNFMQQGITYIYQNTFLTIWRFTSAEITIALNVSQAIGGNVGTFAGGWIFGEKLGGCGSPANRYQCLKYCAVFVFGMMVLSTISAMLLGDTVYNLLHYSKDHVPWGFSLYFVLFVTGTVWAILGSMNGTLYSANMNSVSKEKRATAVSFKESINQFLGYTVGVWVPGFAAAIAGGFINWEDPEYAAKVVRSAQFGVGYAVAMLSGWMLFVTLFLSQRTARKALYL